MAGWPGAGLLENKANTQPAGALLSLATVHREFPRWLRSLSEETLQELFFVILEKSSEDDLVDFSVVKN